MEKKKRRSRNEISTIHDTRGIFNATQRVAGAFGCTLVQDPKCEQPYTDLHKKTIHVGQLNPYWPKEMIDKWLGEVYHEIGHHAKEVQDLTPYLMKNKIDSNSVYGALVNIIEDYRNEMNHRGMYPGRDASLSRTQGWYCNRSAEILAERYEEIESNPDAKLLADALGMVYNQRAVHQPDVAIPALKHAEYTDAEKYSHLQPLLDEMRTIEDVIEVVDAILEQSPDHDPESARQQAQEKFGGKGEEGQEGQEGEEGKGKGGSKAGKGSGKKDKKNKGGKKSKISYKDLMDHTHSPDGKSGSYNPDTSIEYDHDPIYDYKPHEKMLVRKARDLPEGRVGRTEMGRIYKSGKMLSSTARRLFQSRTQSRNAHNHKSGKLDKRDLYRIPSGSKDVFVRKENAPDPKGTALFLLTDASGSMGHGKFEITAAAVSLLNDACSPLGIPIKIAAFTERGDKCEHYIIKEYNERRQSDDIMDDYAKVYDKLYQNADGESIMWAATDLRTRPEERKILIVLSDGCPAADNSGDCYTYTKDVIQHCRKFVELYGVGIQDATVEELYPEYSVLHKADELEKCLLDIIQKKIFKD